MATRSKGQQLDMDKTKAKKKRIRDPEKTREKLLQAAVDLVSEKGPDALSLKEVAIRADVSRSVTYLHFEDRDHLLNEAKAWIAVQLKQGVILFDEEAPLYERILHTTKVVLENPELSRAMMMDALTQGKLDRRHPLFKTVKKRLSDLVKHGKVTAKADLEVRTYIHLGVIAATLLFEKQHRGENVDTLARRFAKEWCDILQQGMFLNQDS